MADDMALASGLDGSEGAEMPRAAGLGDGSAAADQLSELVSRQWQAASQSWLDRRWRLQQAFEEDDSLLGLYSDTVITPP